MSAPNGPNGRRSYVIIGNGIAGTSAAETIRKADQDARIVLIGNEPYPLYNRVALPPYLKLKVTEKKVLMRTVEQHAQKGIELYLNTEAEVDAANKLVRASNGMAFPYDSLLLAVGGTPAKLEVEGANTRGVCYFQTLDDTREILELAITAKQAVTFGGSYIAYELTEGFASRGILVTWIMRGPRFLRQILDDVGGEMVQRLAAMHDVHMIYGEEPGGITVNRDGRLQAAWTKSKKRLPTDLVGCGLGLRLNTRICRGTDIHFHRGILTDRFLETNVSGIYAAGDCAEFYDMYLHIYNTIGTWESAGLQGRLAAHNMMCEKGAQQPFQHVPTYTSTLFDSKITVFGSTPADQPMLESEVQYDMRTSYYKRLFFHEHLLVGGVLIGPAIKARTPLMQIVKERREIPNDERKSLLDLTPAPGVKDAEDEMEEDS